MPLPHNYIDMIDRLHTVGGLFMSKIKITGGTL